MANGTDERDLEVSFPGEDDLEHLIEDYSHLAPPTEGELLQGHIVKITPTEVIVDFGYKLEGIVPIEPSAWRTVRSLSKRVMPLM